MDLGLVYIGGFSVGLVSCWVFYTLALAGYELKKGIESA